MQTPWCRTGDALALPFGTAEGGTPSRARQVSDLEGVASRSSEISFIAARPIGPGGGSRGGPGRSHSGGRNAMLHGHLGDPRQERLRFRMAARKIRASSEQRGSCFGRDT
jgi:hypothetical protein